ncbi:DUF4232 domain-containing protein [Streptomyces cellostaticus]|uniref:DUF4232 domain-containing protein n=1 Tax=Streptomyces cellostaticus TaxID=67285 RepID=UPI0025C8105A|nr:hypothetical protein Scel_45100 [Streptomyces cellostaticus]
MSMPKCVEVCVCARCARAGGLGGAPPQSSIWAGADAQVPLPWAEETTLQAVVTLKSGQSAYAGITTSTPDGEGGAKEKTLGVFFADRTLLTVVVCSEGQAVGTCQGGRDVVSSPAHPPGRPARRRRAARGRFPYR